VRTIETQDLAASSRELMRAVADLVSLIEPRLLSLWQEVGITLSQRRVLRRLRDAPRSAGDVAASLDISAPSLTRMLTKLEDRGLIVRNLDKEDRRRILIELTAAGRRTLEGHRVFSGTPLIRAARRLSATEQRQLAEEIGNLVRLARLELDESFD
jgi:DNA-binding MarR family transcriptional regulator